MFDLPLFFLNILTRYIEYGIHTWWEQMHRASSLRAPLIYPEAASPNHHRPLVV